MVDFQLTERHGVRLAIEGCGHGTLHAIYASIAKACEVKGWPGVDLLIIGGDFQSVRNAYDLNCVAMPAKYREMCDFHEYYSGQRTAPYLTVFVGGNHEASNYLFELYYGGWVAPNIYYMGAANILRVGPLRIAGLSGIWKAYNYRKPHFERLPYNESDIKSIYHVRELDVRRLLQVRTQVDVAVSHDWPRGMEWKGDHGKLFRQKPYFKEDATSGQLGSVAADLVLQRLRPRWWFSAHLHCKYAAVVSHGDGEDSGNSLQNGGGSVDPRVQNTDTTNVVDENEIDLDVDGDTEGPNPDKTAQTTNGTVAPINPDEIDLELEDDENGVAPVAPGQGLDGIAMPTEPQAAPHKPTPTATAPLVTDEARAQLPESFRKPERAPPPEPMEHPTEISNKTTRFLALDKCLPHKEFLQLMNVPVETPETDLDSQRPLTLHYDREWLAITRALAKTEPLVLGDPKATAPRAKPQAEYASLIAEHRQCIDEGFKDTDLQVPQNFEQTAPAYDGGNFRLPQYEQAAGGLKEYSNSQTKVFCEMLGIPNPFDVGEEERAERMAAGPRQEEERFSRGAGRGGGGGGWRGGRGGGGGGGGRGRGFGRGRGRGGGRGRGRGF